MCFWLVFIIASPSYISWGLLLFRPHNLLIKTIHLPENEVVTAINPRDYHYHDIQLFCLPENQYYQIRSQDFTGLSGHCPCNKSTNEASVYLIFCLLNIHTIWRPIQIIFKRVQIISFMWLWTINRSFEDQIKVSWRTILIVINYLNANLKIGGRVLILISPIV